MSLPASTLSLSACYSADRFGAGGFPLRSGPTAYRVDERPGGGFSVTVSRGEFHPGSFQVKI